tara:strand:- start:4455 stop:5252 length:798 start_codon:yes stop_codon:yes gene_type:complete
MLYDWTQPTAALELIKEKILTSIKDEENWYVRHRRWHSIYSRSTRIIAILLFTLGLIWPILNANLKLDEKLKVDMGYISLSIGGLLLLLDKFLGVSSGYVRFYIAELDIKKHTADFIGNWDIESVKASIPMTKENVLALLNIVKQFRESVFTTIQVETGAWATEFQTQTGELYELFKKKQSESLKPANISVNIENYSNYKDIEVGIDDDPFEKLGATTSIIFRNVSIQPHLVKIKAAKHDNTMVTFSKNANVNSDKTTELVLALP